MIDFAHASVFWFLPMPLLVRRLLPPFRDLRPAVRVPLFDVLVESVGETPSKGAVIHSRTTWQAITYVVCWISVITALARPQWLEPPIVRDVPSRDLLLAIDLSGSMETSDFRNAAGKQVDRLTAVKEVLDEFLTKRKGDRVGMIVFGSGAFVQIPFTQDLEVCRQLLDETAVRMAGPKTAFGDAIGLGITLFDRSELDDKVMIALTDGNDTGSRVPPQEAAAIAADKGILIHTIGVGDPEAVGEEELDEQALQAVAKETGGRYFYAADRDELQEIYAELDRLDQRKVETISHQPRKDYFHVPVAVGLLISLLYFAGRWIGNRRQPKNRDLVVAADRGDRSQVAA